MLSSVILVKIHNIRGEDTDYVRSFQINGYPTFVIVSKDGETIRRWWGYRKDDFLNEMKIGLTDPTTISEKRERFTRKPDAKTARALAQYHSTRGELKESEFYYHAAAKYDTKNDYAYDLYDLYRRGFQKELYTKDQLFAAADKALASDYVDTISKLSIYDQMGGGAIRMFPKEEHVLDYIRRGQVFASKVTDEKLQRYKDQIQISYVLYIEKNAKKAVELKKKSYEDGWQDNANNLNSFAWWCFENQINLQEAEKIAERGVKLAEAGSEKANIMDTLAEIVNLLGEPVRAFEIINKAVKEDPESEYLQKQQVRFRNLADPKAQSKVD
jgi:tetratricopeptide (TPR) repeat protein